LTCPAFRPATTRRDDTSTLVADTDRPLLGSQSRLQQLVENPFRSALEHAGPDLPVTNDPVPDGGTVADDGEGVSAERREPVVDSGYASTSRGTGFGLSIVRQVADRHGWNVAVTESADGGAGFECTGIETA
jgi:signal transduction histidine kinase